MVWHVLALLSLVFLVVALIIAYTDGPLRGAEQVVPQTEQNERALISNIEHEKIHGETIAEIFLTPISDQDFTTSRTTNYF